MWQWLRSLLPRRASIPRANKASWQRCEACRRSIPVTNHQPGTPAEPLRFTYVCPYCSHCLVGKELRDEEIKAQVVCHECGTALGGAYQCPRCSFPRGWLRMTCPYCENRQPVFAPPSAINVAVVGAEGPVLAGQWGRVGGSLAVSSGSCASNPPGD